jgi:hypothetical protein
MDLDEEMDAILEKYIQDPLELETVKEQLVNTIADGLHARLFPNSKKRQV